MTFKPLKMRRIDKLQTFKPNTMHDTCTLLHDKAGLKILNNNPNAWKIDQFGKRICNTNGIQKITITSLCNYRFGEQIKLAADIIATILKIEIKRLSDITESEAVCSEIECTENNTYKNYCPQKYNANSLELETKTPCLPNFETALGSFHSLWMKKHGIAEIYANPWVWQYSIKYDKIRSEKK